MLLSSSDLGNYRWFLQCMRLYRFWYVWDSCISFAICIPVFLVLPSEFESCTVSWILILKRKSPISVIIIIQNDCNYTFPAQISHCFFLNIFFCLFSIVTSNFKMITHVFSVMAQRYGFSSRTMWGFSVCRSRSLLCLDGFSLDTPISPVSTKPAL